MIRRPSVALSFAVAAAAVATACKPRQDAPAASVSAFDPATEIPAIVSAEGIAPALIDAVKASTNPPQVPPGAAVIATGGALAVGPVRVAGIIQAATGQPGHPDLTLRPTVQSIGQSLTNSLLLAKQSGARAGCVAVAFLMGGKGISFVRGLEKTPVVDAGVIVARELWRAAVASSRDPEALPVVFMPFAADEVAAFAKVSRGCEADQRVCWRQGGVLDKHLCPFVVISSHLDVQFSDHGLSNVVGKATGKPAEINAAVRDAIVAWAGAQ